MECVVIADSIVERLLLISEFRRGPILSSYLFIHSTEESFTSSLGNGIAQCPKIAYMKDSMLERKDLMAYSLTYISDFSIDDILYKIIAILFYLVWKLFYE